jgi:hypothetical protein
MAKDDKGKIRFVVFEIEGSNETLQESMRTVVQALGRNQGAAARPMIAPPPAALGTVVQMEDEETPIIFENNPAPPAAIQKKATKKRSYTQPKVIKDVNLKDERMPFAALCDKNVVSTTIGKYLVVAAWFKEYANKDAIGIDHIYTCFREMQWPIQADLAQPFRTGKKRAYFDKAGDDWEITHIGLNKVKLN